MPGTRTTSRKRESRADSIDTDPAAIQSPSPSTPLPSPDAQAVQPESTSDRSALEDLAGMDAGAFSSLMEAADSAPRGYTSGQEVTGLVVRLDADNAFIDLGGKAEAQIPLSELNEEEAAVGATVTARVLKLRDEGILLARGLGGAGTPELLHEARDTGIPVDGRVESRNTGGYVVNLSGVRAFCPISQIDRFPGRDLDVFVNRNFQFRVVDIRGRDVIVSRRALQEAELQSNRDKIWETLQPGAAVEGVVTSIRDYGVFVDLGGIEGLIHKSELSWDEVTDPNDLLHRWDRVKVRVLEVDTKRRRVALSLRDPDGSPWARVGSDFVEGQVYEGKVVKIVDFGAFVELAPGVTGLVRLPNLARTRVEKASEAVAVGDAVQVRVLEIDTERERLDLGIRQALPEAEPKAEEESSVGTEIVGIIQQVGRQGLSLRLEDGREAWLSSRDVQLPPGVLLEQRFRRGGRVTARVVDVDRRSGKLRVTQSSSSESDEREAMRRFEKEQSKASNSLGTLADLLSGVKIGGR